MQQHGKQVLQPNGIWYTPISGIWQTVWLETVPELTLSSLKLTPDLDDQSILVEVRIHGARKAFRSKRRHSQVKKRSPREEPTDKPLRLKIRNPHRWWPVPCPP